MKPEERFENIADIVFKKYEKVTPGNMMRSPAIKLNGSVIAFFYGSSMTFKLGKETDFYKYKFVGSTYFNPFKNKPPMKGWLTIPVEFSDEWLDVLHACIEINED